MDRLLEVLERKAKTLGDSELPNEEATKFLGAFLNVYDPYDISAYREIIGFAGYLGAILLTYGINMKFEEMYEYLQNIQSTLDDPELDYENLEKYLVALKKLNDLQLLEDISPNSKRLSRKLKANYKEYGLLDYDRTLFTDSDGRFNERASLSMVKLFRALPEPEKFMAYTDVLDVKFCIADAIGSYEEDFAIFRQGRTLTRMVDKEKEKVVKAIVRDFVKEKDLKLYQHYEDIKKHFAKLHQNIQSFIKEVNRKIVRLESLDNKVTNMSSNERIKLNGDIEKMLIDADIEYYFLLFALKYNLNIFTPVEDKNREYNNNSITKMEILFSKYGYSFSMFLESMQNEIIVKEYESVESILKQVKYSNLGFITEDVGLFFKIIMSSNSSAIKFLDTCFKNKVITKEFILKNSRILYDLEFFNQFFNNFNYILGLGIKPDIKGMENVLLLDSQFLIRHLSLLREYQFDLTGNILGNVEIMKNPKLLDVLDNLIELGYGKTALENPRYLMPNSKDMVKRIMIAQLIGLSPINNQNRFLGSITTGNNFYVGPNDYEKFIIDYKVDYQNPKVTEILASSSRQVISDTVKKLPIINELDNRFMVDSSCYEIIGVRISRLRVMRNLEAIVGNPQISEISLYDLVFQAVLYNMVPNVEADKLTQIYNAICAIEINFPKTYSIN